MDIVAVQASPLTGNCRLRLNSVLEWSKIFRRCAAYRATVGWDRPAMDVPAIAASPGLCCGCWHTFGLSTIRGPCPWPAGRERPFVCSGDHFSHHASAPEAGIESRGAKILDSPLSWLRTRLRSDRDGARDQTPRGYHGHGNHQPSGRHARGLLSEPHSREIRDPPLEDPRHESNRVQDRGGPWRLRLPGSPGSLQGSAGSRHLQESQEDLPYDNLLCQDVRSLYSQPGRMPASLALQPIHSVPASSWAVTI